MSHEPGHAQTVAELTAQMSSSGADPLALIAQDIIASVGASAGAGDNKLLGDLPEGFSAGRIAAPSIRPDWAGAAFQQDTVVPGTAATFRESHLSQIAAWPLEKRGRLILQMQRAGLIPDDVNPRHWDPGTMNSALTEALSFANYNGITDPFEAVGAFGMAKAQAEKKARPTFNFVSRDFLPPDPASVDQDIRKLAKSMFQGTDIELSDEEVANLRGQFEGFLREQHFVEEQNRLSAEKTNFDAQVAASEGRQVSSSVPAIREVDAGARFRQMFEERMKPKTDAIEQMAVDDQSRQVLAGSLGQVMQFATGR